MEHYTWNCAFLCDVSTRNNDVAGNVAFHKTASQSTAKWNETYPATKAVDGSNDTSYAHCAFPNGMPGANAWWKVDLGENYETDRVIIYNGNKGENCHLLSIYTLCLC